MRRAAAALAIGLGGLALRRRTLTWGATRAETSAVLPGDELIPGRPGGSTMAATISAPPGDVWPWLLQMGADRAGFYSWDRLDNHGRPSARRLHADWQDLGPGDRIAAVAGGGMWFEVAGLEPERTLVLRASFGLLPPRPFDPHRRERPRAFSDSIWAFHLRPAPSGATRLLVRGRGTGRPRALLGLLNLVFFDPAHVIMQRRQFTGLARRVAMAPPFTPHPTGSTRMPRVVAAAAA